MVVQFIGVYVGVDARVPEHHEPACGPGRGGQEDVPGRISRCSSDDEEEEENPVGKVQNRKTFNQTYFCFSKSRTSLRLTGGHAGG